MRRFMRASLSLSSCSDFQLRARAELIAERAEAELGKLNKKVEGRGVQAMLTAALKHNAKLAKVVHLLSVRLNESVSAVEQCLKGLYHPLSASFHATGNVVVVREEEFPVATTRCALCALLETYDMHYIYYNAAGDVVDSPYALSTEERAEAACSAV